MSLNFLLLCLFFSLSAFPGGKEGGGGGGICTATKCISLAEAGLRVDELGSKRFRLTVEQVKDISRIIHLIPLDFDKKQFQKKILGRSTDYLLAEASDLDVFRKFSEEYNGILKEENFSSKDFELLGATYKKKTYLLPGFDKLNLRSKSLILIHEGLIRAFGATVKEALSFDGHVLDALRKVETGVDSEMDFFSLMELMEKLKIIKARKKDRSQGDILDRKIVDSELEIQKREKGGVLKRKSYDLLKHRDCILKTDIDLPRPVIDALLSQGYILEKSNSINQGDLILRDFVIQYEEAKTCGNSKLGGLIQYQSKKSLLTVGGGEDNRGCLYAWASLNIRDIAISLFPRCEIKE